MCSASGTKVLINYRRAKVRSMTDWIFAPYLRIDVWVNVEIVTQLVAIYKLWPMEGVWLEGYKNCDNLLWGRPQWLLIGNYGDITVHLIRRLKIEFSYWAIFMILTIIDDVDRVDIRGSLVNFNFRQPIRYWVLRRPVDIIGWGKSPL